MELVCLCQTVASGSTDYTTGNEFVWLCYFLGIIFLDFLLSCINVDVLIITEKLAYLCHVWGRVPFKFFCPLLHDVLFRLTC
jgi:hypothetical protein